MGTFCKNFTLIINQYNMLMADIQPTQGEWNYTKPDTLVAFAEANNLAIRGAPLIYADNLDYPGPPAEWTPGWVYRGDFSREEAIAIMYEQIETTMTHYQDSINEWIVVIEPYGGHLIEGNPGIVVKRTVWSELIGDDYVELAFKYARQVDPDATLIVNEVAVDYLGQYGTGREDGFYLYIQDLLAKGTPIDVVGFEFHLDTEYDSSTLTVEAIVDNFARYGELGLDV